MFLKVFFIISDYNHNISQFGNMASCPPSAAVVEGSNEDLNEKVTVETFETTKETQTTQWLKSWNTSSKFLEVLQGSIEIDRNKACKVK